MEFEDIFDLLIAILLISAVIAAAVLFIICVVIPLAVVAGYGLACYKLGRTLFTRYQHTSKSALALFLAGIGSYSLSIILLNKFFPALESITLFLLLALLPAALIFFLVGVALSEIWVYIKRYLSTDEISVWESQERLISKKIKVIDSQIESNKNRLHRIFEKEKIEQEKIAELEREIEAWEIKDAANRVLLVKEWKKLLKDSSYESWQGQQEQRVENSIANIEEKDKKKIKKTLMRIINIEKTSTEYRNEIKQIQELLFNLNEEKRLLMDQLRLVINEKQRLESELFPTKTKKILLN